MGLGIGGYAYGFGADSVCIASYAYEPQGVDGPQGADGERCGARRQTDIQRSRSSAGIGRAMW
jgi:hypothetical protein